MTLHPSLVDLALRLLLTIVAGVAIGIERGERGHAAGLRTTTLVCLAASLAMIQMNLLLSVTGKAPDFFSVMDVMRLPLGILSGIGFIGAGAILRKGDRVSGVTTAATLWVVTVIGLCLGGGQLWLGVAATALVWLVVSALKKFERLIVRDHKASLVVRVAVSGSDESDFAQILVSAGISSALVEVTYDRDNAWAELSYELRWKARPDAEAPRDVIHSLLELPGVRRLNWSGSSRPQGT